MKKLLLLCVLSVVCSALFAQATDLVVDCQTAGLLSSKINYGDQQTVKNLKVTGIIDQTDLSFIGGLITQYNLDGILDISECHIDYYGTIDEEFHGIPGMKKKDTLRVYKIPQYVKRVDACTYNLFVDTLYFDCRMNYVKMSCFDGPSTDLNCLYLGENIDSIPDMAFLEEGLINTKLKLRSVNFHPNTRYIGNRALPFITSCNFNELKKIEYLGKNSLISTELQDTINIPKSINGTFYIFAFRYRDGQHIIIEDNISIIDGTIWGYWGGGDTNGSTSAKLIFHINNDTPPIIRNYDFSSEETNLSSSTLYVPKGAKQAYINSSWKNANIIELNPAEKIELDTHEIVLDKGYKKQLLVLFTPEDADEEKLVWESGNDSIVVVNENGIVSAVSPGQTYIHVRTSNTMLKDSCLVVVRKNVTGISFEKPDIVLRNIGDTCQLKPEITPVDATEKRIIWKSYNEQVCTVSSEGLVTATGAGTALVTATTVDGGHTATCSVKVIQHVTDLYLGEKTLSLKTGDSEQIHPTINPTNADNKKITWSSSNNLVASVDANGNVKALKAGEAWIKAVSADNAEAKDSCKITVTQPVTGITLSKESHTFDNAGEKMQLTATVLPEDATNKEVRWISSNENVCIVQNGLVTAIAAGTATVTVTTVDGSFTANCIIKVVQHVSKVELNKLTLSLKVDESERLTATISPDNAEDKTVVWSSSNEQVATVDANGNVKALKAGEAWIKAVSVDNAEAKDSCKVTVKQPVTGISLSLETIRLTNIGENIQLEATVLPEDASNKEVKWTSSNESVCVVANGKVIATGFGTTVVMATTIDGGFMASCAVVVERETISVTSVEISQLSASLKKGETLQLSATVKPENATNKNVIWKSSNENVCAVTQTGLVVAIGEGKTIITVVPENGVGQAQCEVNVTSIEDAITDIFSDGHPSKQTVYDMMGRKVTHLVKGHLYIRNGQKFIAK